jgi:hypothetical protein
MGRYFFAAGGATVIALLLLIDGAVSVENFPFAATVPFLLGLFGVALLNLASPGEVFSAEEPESIFAGGGEDERTGRSLLSFALGSVCLIASAVVALAVNAGHGLGCATHGRTGALGGSLIWQSWLMVATAVVVWLGRCRSAMLSESGGMQVGAMP